MPIKAVEECRSHGTEETLFVGDYEAEGPCGHVIGHNALRCLECSNPVDFEKNHEEYCGCGYRCIRCLFPGYYD